MLTNKLKIQENVTNIKIHLDFVEIDFENGLNN